VFDSSQNSTNRGHTVTVALLAAAFVFVPALVAVSQPSSYWLAIGVSAGLITLAWFDFKKSRRVSIPEIATARVAAKR
jgi:hypothetical protein